MSTQPDPRNAQLARLMGWESYEWHDDTKPNEGTFTFWRRGDEGDGEWTEHSGRPPNYTDWIDDHAAPPTCRFSELQAYIRELPEAEEIKVVGALFDALGIEDHVESQWNGWRHATGVLFGVTPSILATAILEVKGEMDE